MAKNIRRMLALVLVMCMFASALPMQALAAEREHGFTKTPTFKGEGMSFKSTDKGAGRKEISVSGTNDSGAKVEMSGSSKSETSSVEDSNSGSVIEKTHTQVEMTGKETSGDVEKNVSYQEDTTETKETASDGTVTEQTITDGLETKEWTENEVKPGQEVPSVQVQLQPGATNSNSGSGSYTKEEDNVAGGSTAQNSDKTTTTTEVDRVVEGTRSESSVTVEKVEGDLTALAPQDYVGKKYDNKEGLLVPGGNGQIHPDFFLKFYEASPESFKANAGFDSPLEQPTDLDGYDYQWTGYGEATNAARAESKLVVYKKDPVTGEPMKDKDGNYIIESIDYAENNPDGMGATPTIFALSKTNEDGTVEYFYGYCIDNDTDAVPTSWYKISNLEDSDYYPEAESAAKLRAVAQNGYWGQESGMGSVAQIKEKVKAYYSADEEATVTIKDEEGNPKTYTASEILTLLDSLSEHEALTATQAAIWSNSNGTLATQDGKDGTIITGIYSVTKPKPNLMNTDRDYDYESDARLQAVYEWLMSLEGVEAKNTIINEKNNFKDMYLTVNGKVEDAAANYDDRKDNDVYHVDLQFTLDFDLNVDDDGNLKDDLYVTLLGADKQPIKDADGNDIRRKLSLTEEEGSIVANKDGVYTLTDLELAEGQDFEFSLQLDGDQVIEEDVYIYSAYGGTDKSQTMVGIASGSQDVNITVTNTLSFKAEERTHIKEERIWHREFDPVITPPEDPQEPPEEPNFPPFEPEENVPVTYTVEEEPAPAVFRLNNQDEAVEEIPEEPVPLAAPVITGDNSGMWIAVMLLAIFAMVAINLFDKKRQHEAF